MAKMFYTATEAAEKLGASEDKLTDLVKDGKLREFRDGKTVNYKVEDIDALVGTEAKVSAPANAAGDGGSSSGTDGAFDELVLEPVDDSSVELAEAASDVISLEETTDEEDEAADTAAAKKAKEDTVVPSVGVNVFDDDELDEQVDPLAQTAVTDVAGLGLEGTGSGSGILDLTRESDDTSLGSELLEEIYTEEEEEKPVAPAEDEETIEMGDATRAGLDEAIPEETTEEDEAEDAAKPAAAPRASGAVVREVVEFGPDPVSAGLSALLVIAIPVMLLGGLAAAALVRGVLPAVLETLYSKLMIFAGGALLLAIIAAVLTFFIAKRKS
ncbi:MAG: helix-turn-helix domain-containing protein [Phycisphaerae bacterium]|jgi:excisionase family DNA binding protein